jgi:hypothetical protein
VTVDALLAGLASNRDLQAKPDSLPQAFLA